MWKEHASGSYAGGMVVLDHCVDRQMKTRPLLAQFFQTGNGWQGFPFHEHQKGASAGGDVG